MGRVETTKFVADSQQLYASVFIESPYDGLVNKHTRFWNTSGFTFEATASGISLHTSSIESLLIGGVAFDLPAGASPGERVENNTNFELYPDAKSINENPYQFYNEFLLLFDTSVKGLVEGAPVLYRGIRIGTVMGVSFGYLHIDKTRATQQRAPKIPVLVHLEPGRWLGSDTQEAKTKAMADIEKSVKAGMRATLKTGNFLTGALVVSFDFYDEMSPGEIVKTGKYDTIPTKSSGFQQIQAKVVELLDNLNNLPLTTVLNDTDTTVKQITKTLSTADEAIKKLNTILENSDTQQIPTSITSTLEELKATLKGLAPDSSLYQNLNDSIEQLITTLSTVDKLSQTIEAKPNSLIFSKPVHPDLQPQAAP